ncbi:Serine protease, subtilase family [Acidisarcina polymorpha]|uniref:Serine protease, subtilase family n=1 Tax=Acidisarcina polymorpha TaxID=2211140 RepID=A0A2Z5FX06_9BACT|nr:putative Ig domain-containing protein [Acidisarcina polymorpha]AXC11423.1 Serine protease, subtilase family [Acidisarcina polymorpha]
MLLPTFRFVCGVFLSALVVGCGGGGSKSNPTPPPVATLAITTAATLTAGTVGTAYTATLAASGGTAPYTWTISAGTPPAGLTLSSAGALTGTPTTAGSSSFTIKVTDSEATPQTATLAATLVINAAPPPPITITPTTLTAGILGTPYVANLTATGGTAPYTWSVASGSLPAGLTLAPTTGIISGTPTAAGQSSFTVQVTDSSATPLTGTQALTLQINTATLAILSTSLPAGNVGSPYTDQLAATGGVAPYTWTAAGALPTGLSLSAAGLLSGTPGTAGTTTVALTVTDAANNTATANLTLTINAATGTVPDGHYVFVFAGTAPQGTPPTSNGVAINGTFTIQSGAIQNGYFDENTNTNPAVTEQAITGGTLTSGANGLGQLVLTTSTLTMTFELAIPASVSAGGSSPIRMIEFDDATGTGMRGSGTLLPALASPTAAAITGNYAFLFSGADIDQNQQALICSFQTDGAGNITNGKADANQYGGTLASWSTLTGTYAVDGNGRGTLQIVLGGTAFHFSFYQVSPTEWVVISLDPATLNSPLVSGTVLQQTGGPFSTASIPTTSVLEIEGLAPVSSGTTPDITLGIATSNGSGAVTFNFDEYAGSLSPGGTFSVNYAVDPTTGRAASTGTTAQPILYIINSTSAFLLGPDRSASSGIIEAQTGAPFTTASFNGNYLGGSLPLVNTSVLNEAGLVATDGAGNITFTTNRSSSTGLTSYQSVAGTYAVGTNGRVVVTTPDNLTRIFYIVSPTKVAYVTSDGGGYLGTFQQ